MDDSSRRGRKLGPHLSAATQLLALVPRFSAPCPSKLNAVSRDKGGREAQHGTPSTVTPSRHRSLPYNPGLAIRIASHGSTTPTGHSIRSVAAASSIFNANRNRDRVVSRQPIPSAAPQALSTPRFQRRAPPQGQSAGRSPHLPLSALLSRGSAHSSQGASWDRFMSKAQGAQSQQDNRSKRHRSTPASKKKRGQVLCREFVRKLSREQRAIACHPSDSHLMMLAPAGSGKSRTLVARILWLLQNTPGLREEEVLAVTFTTKAAREMKERIAHILPEGSLNETARSSSRIMDGGKGSCTAYGHRIIKSVFNDGVLATNFHAMCYKIVQRNVGKLEKMNLLKSMPGSRKSTKADVLTGYKRDKLLRRCIEVAWMRYQREEHVKKLAMAAQPQQTAVVVGDTPSSKASANASATASVPTTQQQAPCRDRSFSRASSLYKLDSDSSDDFESDSDNEILGALDAIPANETAEDDGGPKKRLRSSPKHINIEGPVKGSDCKPHVAPPSPQRSPRRQSMHIKDVVRKTFGIANAYIALVKAFMSTDLQRRNVQWPVNKVPSIQTRLLDLVFNEYQQALFEMRAIDFDDMVSLTVRLLQTYPCTAIGFPMFKFILCDEFQDTSKVQLTLLKALASGGNLSSSKAKSARKRNIATAPTASRAPRTPTHQCRVLVCGDDDQCIYGWRAGTVNAFQVFETNFGHEGVKKLFLSENYRCSRVISTAASALIQLNPDRLKENQNTLSNQVEGRKILLLNCVKPEHEYFQVFNAIHALWNGAQSPAVETNPNRVAASVAHQVLPKPPLSSICVLARTNALVRDAVAFFKKRGLPVREKDTSGFRQVLESSEAKDIVAYFDILNAPIKSRGQVNDALLRVYCRPPSGVSKKVISELQSLAHGLDSERGTRLSTLELLERIATGNDAPRIPDAVKIKMPELVGLHQRFVKLRNALRDHSNVGDMVRTLVTAVAYDEFVAGKARKSSHEKAKSCGVLDLLAKRLTQADEDMTALQANDGGKMFGARIAATGPRRFDAALRTIFCQEQEKLAEEKRQQQEQQRRARWASGGYGAKHGDIKRKSGFGQSANIDTKSRSSEVEGSGCADGLNVMTIHQAKGLEWDHVFVIRVNEACLPLSDTENQFAAATGQEAVAALLGGSLEEERRLCYVAFTRARKTLTLSTCRQLGNGDNLLPSRFLLDVPPQFICRKEDLAPLNTTKEAAEASSLGAATNKVVERVAHDESSGGSVTASSATMGNNREPDNEFSGDFGDLSEIADELSEEQEDRRDRGDINRSNNSALVFKGAVDRGNPSECVAVPVGSATERDDAFGDLLGIVNELVDDEVEDEFGDLSCVVDDLGDDDVEDV